LVHGYAGAAKPQSTRARPTTLANGHSSGLPDVQSAYGQRLAFATSDDEQMEVFRRPCCE